MHKYNTSGWANIAGWMQHPQAARHEFKILNSSCSAPGIMAATSSDDVMDHATIGSAALELLVGARWEWDSFPPTLRQLCAVHGHRLGVDPTTVLPPLLAAISGFLGPNASVYLHEARKVSTGSRAVREDHTRLLPHFALTDGSKLSLRDNRATRDR